MKLIKITSRYKKIYLEERGILPVYEEYEEAWYKPTKKLRLLLEDYQITAVYYQSLRKR